jgi:hypothetical protein
MGIWIAATGEKGKVSIPSRKGELNMKNWYLQGVSYTRREFTELLKSKGLTIPYEKTRKAYQRETSRTDATIYRRGDYWLAVI